MKSHTGIDDIGCTQIYVRTQTFKQLFYTVDDFVESDVLVTNDGL